MGIHAAATWATLSNKANFGVFGPGMGVPLENKANAPGTMMPNKANLPSAIVPNEPNLRGADELVFETTGIRSNTSRAKQSQFATTGRRRGFDLRISRRARYNSRAEHEWSMTGTL